MANRFGNITGRRKGFGTPQPIGNSFIPGQQPLVSRRAFLYGAIGVGAVAAGGIGLAAYNAAVNSAEDVKALNVPTSALSTQNDFEVLEPYGDFVKVEKTFDLPYGTLVWVNDDSVAGCLIPTDQGSPLSQVGILSLSTGMMHIVLDKAVQAADQFEIYDVRATSDGVIWTEANILQGLWSVYCAQLKDNALGTPTLLEQGDETYDTPTIAASGRRAFWQVLPKVPDPTAPDIPVSRLMGATFGKDDGKVVFESKRRMGAPPYANENTVTIAPRLDFSSVYYQLTNIDADSGDVKDTLTLPAAITPLECGYGDTGFMFSFPDIYQRNSAIANLGTYAPMSRPSNSDYSSVQWFCFARTPTAPPAWCDGLLIVKSTYSVCGVNLNTGKYFAIDVENGADNYGEYLASSGSRNRFVTFTNIDHTPINEPRVYACRVKVWKTT